MLKNLLIICTLINYSCLTLYAQSSESDIKKEFYKADPQISIILHYLPEHWSFTADDSTFYIRSTDTVWVLEENRINAPVETKEAQTERILKYGHWVFPEIQLTYGERWTPEQIQFAKIANATIDNEIRSLPEKFHIAHLLDQKLSGKRGIVYTATNEKEQKQIDQYEQEVAWLEATKVVVPKYHTEKYSLFLKKITGATDEMHLVYPGSCSLELYTILGTFREVCGQ